MINKFCAKKNKFCQLSNLKSFGQLITFFNAPGDFNFFDFWFANVNKYWFIFRFVLHDNKILCLVVSFVFLLPIKGSVILNKKVLKFEIDLDFELIAITSSLKDYRLCFLINRALNFDFAKTDDLQLDLLPGPGKAFFSFYKYNQGDNGAEFFLISNKGTEGYLIPEMNKTDYLLMIKNYIDENELEELVTGLNRVPEIVAAVKVDPKKIKSRENLLF